MTKLDHVACSKIHSAAVREKDPLRVTRVLGPSAIACRLGATLPLGVSLLGCSSPYAPFDASSALKEASMSIITICALCAMEHWPARMIKIEHALFDVLPLLGRVPMG